MPGIADMTLCPHCGKDTESPARLTVGDLEADLNKRTLTRAGKSIHLTVREFDALVFMMRNAGKELTRTDIMAGAWKLPFEGLTNQVDVYINYLRAKVDEPFDGHMIETVRFVGYRLNAHPALSVV